MRKSHFLFGSAIGLMLLGAACAKQTTVNTAEETNTSTEVENTSVGVNENANLDTTVNANTSVEDRTTNTNTSDDTATVTQGSLTVTSPKANADVESPLEVEGKSGTSTVYVRVKNSAGGTLFTEPVTVRSGEFHVNLTLTMTSSKALTLEVFQKDSAGKEVNLVAVPVSFKTDDSSTTKIKTSDDNSNGNDNGNTNESENKNTNDDNNTNSLGY